MNKVCFSVEDGVGKLVLNNPDKANCIDADMAGELSVYCDDIDSDPSVGCVIVSGSGGSFCSGADRQILASVAEDPSETDSFFALGQIYEAFQRVGRLTVPTIAVVRGAAVGAGVNLMLATDLRLVADDARIQPGFHRLGLHPGGGHFALLGRAANWEASAALGLFGAELTGIEAVRIGLAWRHLPDIEVEVAAEKYAAVAAVDPELSRQILASMKTELGPPALSWLAASELERARQMWSLRRSPVLAASRKRDVASD
jgi:enoyl-CoA hydratase